jgi:hypothetical protein
MLMFCTFEDGNAPCRNEGDYKPWLHWTLAHELDGAMSVFALRWCITSWASDVVLTFIPVYGEQKMQKIHIYVCVCVHFYSRAKQNKGGAQSHGPAPESRVSCKSFKIRVTASRTSWVVFRSLGLSPIGRKPKSIRTPATCVPVTP